VQISEFLDRKLTRRYKTFRFRCWGPPRGGGVGILGGDPAGLL